MNCSVSCYGDLSSPLEDHKMEGNDTVSTNKSTTKCCKHLPNKGMREHLWSVQ